MRRFRAIALGEHRTEAVLNNRGEFEGGIDVVAAAPVLVENAAVPASATPADFRRITTLRLEAVRHAQRAVRIQMLTAGQVIQGPERTHLEQVAKFKFYLDSGEAALIKEALAWAIANPGALPSVLQNADSLLRNLTNPPLDEATTPNPAEPASHQSPTADSSEQGSSSAAVRVELPTKPSSTTPPPAKQKQQPSHHRLQPVEILASAGDWVGGYFVHSCIAVDNLVGQERQFTLFDADGGTYSFWGQIGVEPRSL